MDENNATSPIRPSSSIMIEIDLNKELKLEEKYGSLNKDRLNHAATCDVDIVIGEGDVSVTRPCHREVLSNAFTYFETRYHNVDIAKNTPTNRILQAEPFTNAVIFEKLMCLAYTGKLRVSKWDAYDTFHDCLIFEFKYADHLWKVLFARNYFRSRVLDFFLLFERQHLKMSQGWRDTIQYMAEHITELSQQEELFAVPVEKLRSLMRHLPEYVNDDELVLDFIIRWGRRLPKERKDFIPALLANVNLKNASGTFAKNLTVKLFNSERTYKDEWRRKFVADSETRTLKTFVQMRNKNNYHFFEYELSRNGEWNYANAEIVGGYSVTKFARIQDRIFNIFKMYGVDVGADDNKYPYVFRSAHITKYKSLLKVESEYIRASKTPVELKMSLHRLQMTATDTNIFLYVSATGTNSSSYLKCYNSERNKWKSVKCNNASLTSGSAMVSHDKLLYLLGGESTRTANFYDRRVMKWNKLPQMRHTHSCGAACVYDGKIYVAGGRNQEVEMYDPAAGKWERVSSLLVKRDFFSLVPYNHSIWAIGSHYSLSTEIYDPRNDCWSMFERSMVRARGDLMLVDLWPPQYRYTDHEDTVPANVMDTLTF